MSLTPLLIIISITLLIALVSRQTWRPWVLMVSSILAIYWLQPSTPIRNLDFWLPTFCLVLASLSWLITIQKDQQSIRSNLPAGLTIIAMIILIGLSRYLGNFCCLTATRPPPIYQIIILIALIGTSAFLFLRYSRSPIAWVTSFSALLLVLFIILKSDMLSSLASIGLRSINGQSTALASGLDIRWLGFSYIAFRLLHTLQDRLSGRLPSISLQDFITYIIFFPSFTAGPIDRVQHFVQNLHQDYHPTMEVILTAGKRILVGIFRKFVLADGLALFALNNLNAAQVNSTGWLWIMIYAYAFRIYFDFSGYTDIAIGLGNLLGFQLPENFDKPYQKRNLTLFWNSWHMTLAAWFRAYFFNPLTRALRTRSNYFSLPAIILIGQLSTFVLIGLWHGITWNFAIWGAWHGIGLFIHNRWSDFARAKFIPTEHSTWVNQLMTGLSTFVTFNYVCLGWIWFALSTPTQSWQTFMKLFGLT